MDATQGINYGLKSLNLILSGTSIMSDVLFKTLKMCEKDPMVKAMRDVVGRGDAEFVFCNKDEMAMLQKKLKEAGVDCVVGTYGDKGMIITNKKDHEMAQETINKYYAAREHGGIIDKEMFESYSDNRAKQITGLDEAETSLFVKRCENNNVPVSVEGPDNGEYSIRFALKDESKINRIRLDVATELAGEAGKLLRNQLEYENKHFCEIQNAILNGKYLDDKPLEKDSVVVDRDGKEIKIGNHSVELTDGNNKVTLNRPDDNFKNRLNLFMCEMNRPELLTKEQHEEFKNAVNKDDFLIDIERQNGRPSLSQSEMEIVAKAKRQREVVEEKLAQDHPDSDRMPFSDYNDEQSMFGFKEAERRNFEATHDMGESQHPDAVILDDASNNYRGWKIEDLQISVKDEIDMDQIVSGYEMGTPDYDFDRDLDFDDLDELDVDME